MLICVLSNKAVLAIMLYSVFRHVMEGSLPNSLKHIISNAEYYGPSLFLLATDVVTAYVFQVWSLTQFMFSVSSFSQLLVYLET